jgi:hypothetical protein
MSGRTEGVDTVGALSLVPSFGFCTGSANERAIGGYSLEAAATSDVGRSQVVDGAVVETNGTAITGILGLQTFDADGFTMVVVDAWVTNRRVHYLALGGDSITNAKASHFTMANALGNQAVTGVGFQPDLVILAGRRSTSDANVWTAGSSFTIGAARSSTQRAVLANAIVDAAATTDTARYCNDIECYTTNPQGGGSTLDRADFVSMDADGFTVNWLEAGAANRVHYLAIKGGNFLVGSLLTSTTLGATISETGFGFAPSAVLMVSHGTSESVQDTKQTHFMLSVGAATGMAERVACALRDEDLVATENCASAVEYDEVYANLNTATDTIDGLMDLQSMDADGFTAVMDDADPAQSFVWYVAFGPAEAAVGQPTQHRTQGVPTGSGRRDRPGGWN